MKSYPQLQNKLETKSGMKKKKTQNWKTSGPDEEDPGEWIDRVADEVEEKRLQTMQML